MERYKKGDVNLLLFILVSALFVFGMAILWSKNWLIDEYPENYPVILSKAALEKRIIERRNKREEEVKKTFEIDKEQQDNKTQK